jgi:hypothetical protein
MLKLKAIFLSKTELIQSAFSVGSVKDYVVCSLSVLLASSDLLFGFPQHMNAVACEWS